MFLITSAFFYQFFAYIWRKYFSYEDYDVKKLSTTNENANCRMKCSYVIFSTATIYSACFEVGVIFLRNFNWLNYYFLTEIFTF